MNSITNMHRLVVLGKVGAGKSSVLNSLTATDTFNESKFKIGSTKIKEIQVFTGRFKRRFTSPHITFIETPGFFDCSSSDNRIVNKIATYLNKMIDGSNLVLFCFPAYEIHVGSSVQASCRFLKMMMNKISYDQIIIILTHGNRLTPEEFEKAVVRITTDFIPYLRDILKFRVKDEVFVYNKGKEQDGLDSIFNYFAFNKQDGSNRVTEFSFQEAFNKVQDLLFEVQKENQIMRHEIDKMKKEMEKGSKVNVKDVQVIMEDFVKEEKRSFDKFKEEMKKEIDTLKLQLANKDKEILELKANEKKLGMKKLENENDKVNEMNSKENIKPIIKRSNKYESPQPYKTYTHNHSLSLGEYHTSAPTEPYSKIRLTSLLKSIDTISKSRAISTTTATSTHSIQNIKHHPFKNPIAIDLLNTSRDSKQVPIVLKSASTSRPRGYCYTDRLGNNYQC